MHRILEAPSRKRCAEFLAAVARSGDLHQRLVSPPRTVEAFERYLARMRGPANIGYWIRTPEHELAGVVNVTEIVRGTFQSAYLGYYAFLPHAGHGHMSRGLRAVLGDLFRVHRLHRVEANIQPGNDASRNLVGGLGFRQEGFSPRYLKIAGRWRDHERWALTVEDWRKFSNAREQTT
jgi:ribosomal-protein-alanine N-acetyltransferase